MLCRRCGKDLGNSLRCKFCGYVNTEGNVREMTRIERNFYDGVTIDIDESGASTGGQRAEQDSNSYRRSGFGGYYSSANSRRTFYTSSGGGLASRLFGKLIDGLMNNSRIAKIAATLIVVAISALMFFIAIPILFVLLAMGIALFMFSRIGR